MTAYKRSVGANTQSVYSKIYATDTNTAWQAVLDSLKSVRLDVTNREAGYLQTRWMDNTKEKNFTDGDGSTAPYMKAQYRIKVSVAKGVYQGRNAVKVTVQREQVAQRDALDDFRPLESDSIEENTLLYRIGRIITLKTRLAKLEEYRTKLEMRQATMSDPTFGTPGGNEPPPPPSSEESSEIPPPPESEEAFAPSS
jgi:hypothetical protein